MDAQLELTTNEKLLVQHAEAIRVLGRRAVRDVIEIGRRLSEAKEIAGHGSWLPWLEDEFGWKEQSARNFMNVYEMSTKSPTVGDLNIDMRGLYLLAAPSTPFEVIDAVAVKAKTGENVSVNDVRKLIEETRAKDQEGHAKELKKQHEAAERRLEKAVENYKQETEKLKQDLEGTLSEEEIQQTINDALAPLREKIKKYQEAERKRKEKLKSKGPKDEFGLRAQAITSALQHLSDVLVITPEQVLTAQNLITKITGQSMASGLASEVKHAKVIKAWLDKFIQITRGLK